MNEEQQKKQEQDQFELLIQGFIDNQCGISDDLFNPSTIVGLRNKLIKHTEFKELKSAGIGNQASYQNIQKIRGDDIKWIETDSIDPFETLFINKITALISYLNKTCYTALTNFESHYANYEKHRFYKRHLDQFKSDQSRKYSMILYLNEDWTEADGGHLSIYPENLSQKDISPLGGRIVFFRSAELEHEVQPSTTRNRMSIAGWFKN